MQQEQLEHTKIDVNPNHSGGQKQKNNCDREIFLVETSKRSGANLTHQAPQINITFG